MSFEISMIVKDQRVIAHTTHLMASIIEGTYFCIIGRKVKTLIDLPGFISLVGFDQKA